MKISSYLAESVPANQVQPLQSSVVNLLPPMSVQHCESQVPEVPIPKVPPMVGVSRFVGEPTRVHVALGAGFGGVQISPKHVCMSMVSK